MNIQSKIIAFLAEQKVRPKTAKELAEIFEVDRYQRKTFYELLEKMAKEGALFQNAQGKYGVNEQFHLIKGNFIGHSNGFGFVSQERGEDIFIPANRTQGAMHEDIVLIRIVTPKSGNNRAEGEIVRILERKNTTIIGVFHKNTAFGFVIPDQKKLSQDVFISKDHINGAQNGEKVLVKIIKWPEKDKNPEGIIIEILGKSGEINTEVESIIKKFGLSETFEDSLTKEAEKIAEIGIEPREKEKRLDLRNRLLVTIDGIDAKDLDDAVSLEKFDNGNYRLGVHIADVSHYVREGSLLDREALKRGTSVYLVDRVLPMFPKAISNGICSLNPKEDRLCLSVIMEVDEFGKVIKHEVKETIIHSQYRLNYKEVSDFLETKEGVFREDEQLGTMLIQMEQLSKLLFENRKRRGAIDFEFDEIYIELDDEKQVTGLKKRERRIGHRIIEEFMLLCNETVAEQFYWLESPFVYRIHEEPNSEKVEAFNQFVRKLGYVLRGQMHAKNFQMLLEEVKDKKEGFVISTLLLRSMQKARYTAYQDMHFGLSCQYYTHFTSPIRRYPDLQIHRIIKDFVNGRLDERRREHYAEILDGVTAQNSKSERTAQEAERECDDLFMAAYMQDFIGEEFKGNVSGITSFGMFVRLDNLVEGLIPMSLMPGYFIYDDVNFLLKDEKKGLVFGFGDPVTVCVREVNIQMRTIDFELIEDLAEEVEG